MRANAARAMVARPSKCFGALKTPKTKTHTQRENMNQQLESYLAILKEQAAQLESLAKSIYHRILDLSPIKPSFPDTYAEDATDPEDIL